MLYYVRTLSEKLLPRKQIKNACLCEVLQVSLFEIKLKLKTHNPSGIRTGLTLNSNRDISRIPIGTCRRDTYVHHDI